VFAPGSQPSDLRFGLISGDESVATSIQGVNRMAQDDGLIPLWLAVYGDANDPRFAGIWVSNTDKVAWNADGLVESAGDYQTRFNVHTSAWCRPALPQCRQTAISCRCLSITKLARGKQDMI
jgi:hypothetical protein